MIYRFFSFFLSMEDEEQEKKIDLDLSRANWVNGFPKLEKS